MTNTITFDLLRDPRKNKGTGFTREERDRYGLNGLLPGAIETIETQAQRAHEQVDRLEKPINQYVYLLQLLDNNEKLFFKLLMSDPAKFMPPGIYADRWRSLPDFRPYLQETERDLYFY